MELARDQVPPVGDDPLFTEALSVVSDDHDMGLEAGRVVLEAFEQAAEGRVERIDVDIIEPAGTGQRRRRILAPGGDGNEHSRVGQLRVCGITIRAVGIKEVEPEELAPGADVVEQGQGPVGDVAGEGVEGVTLPGHGQPAPCLDLPGTVEQLVASDCAEQKFFVKGVEAALETEPSADRK